MKPQDGSGGRSKAAMAETTSVRKNVPYNSNSTTTTTFSERQPQCACSTRTIKTTAPFYFFSLVLVVLTTTNINIDNFYCSTSGTCVGPTVQACAFLSPPRTRTLGREHRQFKIWGKIKERKKIFGENTFSYKSILGPPSRSITRTLLFSASSSSSKHHKKNNNQYKRNKKNRKRKKHNSNNDKNTKNKNLATTGSAPSPVLQRVLTQEEESSFAKKRDITSTVPSIVSFVEPSDPVNAIECYIDSIATMADGETRYTIGIPCDHPVALCVSSQGDEIIPVELDDPLMDEIFPIAQSTVEEELQESSLERTPQTLTLVGELDDDEDGELLDVDEDSLLYDMNEEEDDEEEVEILLSFEHNDCEVHLVRLLDPLLLVGKEDPSNDSNCRLLLNEEESLTIMPIIEELFLNETSLIEHDNNEEEVDASN